MYLSVDQRDNPIQPDVLPSIHWGEEENPELHSSGTFIVTPPQSIFQQNVTKQLPSLEDFSCVATVQLKKATTAASGT